MVWVVKSIVRQEMNAANKEQTEYIAGRYMPSMTSNLTGAEIQRRLADLKDDIEKEEASRKKHAQAQLDTIIELRKGLAIMQARADTKGDPVGGGA